MDHNAAGIFGQYIKGIRKRRKLSVRELASKAEISPGELSRLENGKRSPRPDTLKALAAALEVSLADLFAMAGYTVPYDLPSLAPYLHTRYSNMPKEKISAMNDYLERVIDEHGLDPNGPLAFDDETDEVSQR